MSTTDRAGATDAGVHTGSGQRRIDSLGDVLDSLIETTEGQEKISLSDALDAFGPRSFGPLILVPAVLLTLPTGALPGVPIALGAFIAFVCLELLLGRTRPSIPSLLGKLKFSREGIAAGRRKGAGVIGAIDGVLNRRLDFMTKPPMIQLVAVVCIALCGLLVPVEFIPFATAIPGGALVLMGLAITARDGLVAMTGVALAVCGALAIWLLVW